jgi:hypothetical protein
LSSAAAALEVHKLVSLLQQQEHLQAAQKQHATWLDCLSAAWQVSHACETSASCRKAAASKQAGKNNVHAYMFAPSALLRRPLLRGGLLAGVLNVTQYKLVLCDSKIGVQLLKFFCSRNQ